MLWDVVVYAGAVSLVGLGIFPFGMLALVAFGGRT